eukprot:2135452-Alexandrium_andersonii.AAC.1
MATTPRPRRPSCHSACHRARHGTQRCPLMPWRAAASSGVAWQAEEAQRPNCRQGRQGLLP